MIQEDLTGLRFGGLLVESAEKVPRRGFQWRCRCACGSSSLIATSKLRAGQAQCGYCSTGGSRVRHGQSRDGGDLTAEYRVWSGMKKRCGSPASAGYQLYGGRGIRVCERWQKFENFIADVGPRPSRKHSVDRINNDGNYEPGNVRWATTAEQNRNKRTNVMLTIDGVTLCRSDWADRLGISRLSARQRMRRGWSLEEAFGLKPRSISK